MKTHDPRPPCLGSVNVIPVPAGMTPDQAWDEILTLGRLERRPSSRGLTWAAMSCPGGDDCRCRHVELWRHYRRYRNDRLVEARLWGRRAPRWLLPVLDAVGQARGRR